MRTNENLKNSQMGNENLSQVKGGWIEDPRCPRCGNIHRGGDDGNGCRIVCDCGGMEVNIIDGGPNGVEQYQCATCLRVLEGYGNNN